MQQRYVVGSFIVGAILAAMVVQSAMVSVFAQWSIQDASIGGLVASSTVAGGAAGLVTFLVLVRRTDAVQFTTEVVGELAKVTWPTKDETVKASTTVVMTTLFTAALVAFYDLVWKNVADIFLFTEI